MNNCQSSSSELSMVNDAMRLNTLFKRFAAYSVVLPLLTVDLELPSSLTLSGGSCVGILFFPLLFSLFINYGVFYKLVFMFLSGCLFCLVDFGLSFASVSFSFSHYARIAPSFIRDICCMIASKSPQANL